MGKTKKNYNDPWDRDFYETGSTRPPKQNGGLIAFLLVLVVLLGSICSAMGILNIHLLKRLAEGEQPHETLNLFDDQEAPAAPDTIPTGRDQLPLLGINGQTVSEFDRNYYALPQGVLVTDVAEDLCGYEAGIRAGDVIFSLEGQEVTSQEELSSALSRYDPGQKIRVEVYRSQTQEQFSATIIISEDEKE